MKEILSKMKSNSKLIDEKDFDDLFDKAWKNMKTLFTKLEAEQYYQCDMNDSYNNYINGNYGQLLDTFKDFSQNWPSIFEEKPNIKSRRLHLISIPITEYINYEMYFYLMNEKAGEKIKCLNFDDTKYKLGEIDDFIIFDNEMVIINCHSKDGEYLKSYYYDEDKNLIKDLLEKYNDLYKKGNSYKDYVKFSSSILDKMKENNLI